MNYKLLIVYFTLSVCYSDVKAQDVSFKNIKKPLICGAVGLGVVALAAAGLVIYLRKTKNQNDQNKDNNNKPINNNNPMQNNNNDNSIKSIDNKTINNNNPMQNNNNNNSIKNNEKNGEPCFEKIPINCTIFFNENDLKLTLEKMNEEYYLQKLRAGKLAFEQKITNILKDKKADLNITRDKIITSLNEIITINNTFTEDEIVSFQEYEDKLKNIFKEKKNSFINKCEKKINNIIDCYTDEVKKKVIRYIDADLSECRKNIIDSILKYYKIFYSEHNSIEQDPEIEDFMHKETLANYKKEKENVKEIYYLDTSKMQFFPIKIKELLLKLAKANNNENHREALKEIYNEPASNQYEKFTNKCNDYLSCLCDEKKFGNISYNDFNQVEKITFTQFLHQSIYHVLSHFLNNNIYFNLQQNVIDEAYGGFSGNLCNKFEESVNKNLIFLKVNHNEIISNENYAQESLFYHKKNIDWGKTTADNNNFVRNFNQFLSQKNFNFFRTDQENLLDHIFYYLKSMPEEIYNKHFQKNVEIFLENNPTIFIGWFNTYYQDRKDTKNNINEIRFLLFFDIYDNKVFEKTVIKYIEKYKNEFYYEKYNNISAKLFLSNDFLKICNTYINEENHKPSIQPYQPRNDMNDPLKKKIEDTIKQAFLPNCLPSLKRINNDRHCCYSYNNFESLMHCLRQNLED